MGATVKTIYNGEFEMIFSMIKTVIVIENLISVWPLKMKGLWCIKQQENIAIEPAWVHCSFIDMKFHRGLTLPDTLNQKSI